MIVALLHERSSTDKHETLGVLLRNLEVPTDKQQSQSSQELDKVQRNGRLVSEMSDG